MPKVKLGYGVGDYLARRIKRAGYTQTGIARKLGISQPALAMKIKRNKFSYDDLKEIFTAIQATDAEIVKVMRGFL